MLTPQVREKRTISTLTYIGRYKLALTRLYSHYVQALPYAWDEAALYQTLNDLAPVCAWKLDGTATLNPRHLRLTARAALDEMFPIDGENKDILLYICEAAFWRELLVETLEDEAGEKSRLKRYTENDANLIWVTENRTFGEGMPVFHSMWDIPDIQALFFDTIGKDNQSLQDWVNTHPKWDMWNSLDGEYNMGLDHPVTRASIEWMNLTGKPWTKWAEAYYQNRDLQLGNLTPEGCWYTTGGYWQIDPTRGRELVAFPARASTLPSADLFGEPPFVNMGLVGNLSLGPISLELGNLEVSIKDLDLTGESGDAEPVDDLPIEFRQVTVPPQSEDDRIIVYTMPVEATERQYATLNY